jgi:hypothetical protein
MAAFETSTSQYPCPTDEELAAFLDGTLTKAERESVTSHLADCESCYEIFAGAVHFRQDGVVPFPSKKKRWWIPAAAAAVLAVGVGLAGYQAFVAPPEIAVKNLVAQLPPTAAQEAYHYATYRGGSSKGSLISDRPSFMVGLLLVDAGLNLRQEGTKAPELLEEIGRKLEQVAFAQEETKAAARGAALLRSGGSAARRKVAAALLSREAGLEKALDSSFGFGKWSEAGRLAAVTRTPAFFKDRQNRRFLEGLLKDPKSIDEDVREPLAAIKATWDRGDLHADDYKKLAGNFTEIIHHYDTPSAE